MHTANYNAVHLLKVGEKDEPPDRLTLLQLKDLSQVASLHYRKRSSWMQDGICPICFCFRESREKQNFKFLFLDPNLLIFCSHLLLWLLEAMKSSLPGRTYKSNINLGILLRFKTIANVCMCWGTKSCPAERTKGCKKQNPSERQLNLPGPSE